MKLLYDLLNQFGVSGDESPTSDFLLHYINKSKASWATQPEVFSGEEFHDCILLKFGSPKTALFAHIDTIGFMVRYENQLVAVGGPEVREGVKLVGKDSHGDVFCKLIGDEDDPRHDFPRAIDRGARLAFAQDIRIDDEFIQAAYLDNRLGVYTALKVCESLEHGWVVFTTYEEHGGGSMPFLLSFIQQESPIKQALIADITWVTDGVLPKEGVVISIRDKFIPRKKFLDRVIGLAEESGIPYQLEVEASGGSDGREVQFSPYAIDWCFVGAAEENVHSPDEKVALVDLEAMIELHQYLMKNL
ncbi:M20/M25/M40 family metallo-hydrolase [Algoriphagus vanfongensis]|uniref:M20/M25/M40 family metallo-hydrolase n=1 Tax=Algoriphagus vanfongensis TaxID=426371 RepID=UPI000413402C|nr:M20/M25/M40 family metallo-hydrolase [Algoriphagus vanfongensis]